MTTPQTIELDGRRYVVVPEDEYRRIIDDFDPLNPDAEGPPLPDADANGHYPAIETARAIMARNLIHDRKTRGLTQSNLAELAGVRQETISRIESGKQAASIGTMDKIDAALKAHDHDRADAK